MAEVIEVLGGRASVKKQGATEQLTRLHEHHAASMRLAHTIIASRAVLHMIAHEVRHICHATCHAHSRPQRALSTD